MATHEDGVVAGLFATRAQAMTVEKSLRRIGLADRDIEIGTPAPGRYRLEIRESESLGRAALDGIVIGTLVGAVIGALVIVVAVPQAMAQGAGAVVLGLLMGGFWGSFFGGLAGMAIKSAGHGGESQWCAVPEGSTAFLVIARAGADAGVVRKLMRRDGAGTLLSQVPSIVSTTDTSLPAGGGGAASAGSEDRNGHTGAPGISIPRGAFLLLVIFLLAVSALWANVYLRVVWRA